MCGLNFLIDRIGKGNEDVIKSMNVATTHRGPDHTSYLIKKKYNMKILMGVNRLRIIDNDPRSDQPFCLLPEYYLLYNGEIYNHQEIKDMLLHKGIQFTTSSDTEILYYYLIVFGKQELHRLNGMFSFVFVDLVQDEITIARDVCGMKPLYYYIDDNFLIVSSEIQGILASGYVNKEFNAQEIPHYLYYKYTSPGNTFYKNIYQVKKGGIQTYNIKSGKLTEESIQIISDRGDSNIDTKISVKTVEKLIVNALKIHTQANVPLGLFLSGGVDSTLLLALSMEYKIHLPYCFSISNKPSERQYGTADYRYIQMAVDQFKCDTMNLEVGDEILEDLEEMINKTDQPIADGATLLTYILSREAKKQVGVVLSGAGGDELFAGYNRHQAFYFYLKYYGILKKLKGPYSRINHLITSGLFSNFRKKKRLIDKFVDNIDPNPDTTFNNFLGLQNLFNYNYLYSWPEFSGAEFIGKNFERAIESDRHKYLPEDVLTVNDRMTMLSGLEMRMPYLDMDLVKYVYHSDPEILIKKGQKWILKKILKKYTGNKFIHRPKEGFGFPFGLWINRPKNKYLIDEILNDNNPLFTWIDRSKTKQIILAHLKGKADYSQEIWGILVLTKWIRKHF
jgi:asparagine synthase (glutamine-hydrolysing)